jgi:tetratricopeptide (TPR) repeat protein
MSNTETKTEPIVPGGFLNREITLSKAALILVAVVAAASVILYGVGQKYFWQPLIKTPQERGLAYYQALVQREPHKPQHWVDLGWHYYQAGDFEKALENHRKALEIKPGYFGALYNAGITCVRLEDYAAAAGYLEQATAESPRYWEAYLALGVARIGLEEWAAAVTALDAALELNWHTVETHYYLGYALEKMGELEEARTHYEEALRYNPEFTPAKEALERLAGSK